MIGRFLQILIRKKIGLLLLILLILSIQCSKGDQVISPIIPDTVHQKESIHNDSFWFDTADVTRYANVSSHPQVSPIMDLEILEDAIEKLNRKFGVEKLADGQLEFLWFEPEKYAEQNPPLFQFAIATSLNAISPDDITFTVNGADVSSNIRYNYASIDWRNSSIMVGSVRMSEYLNPNIQHECNVKIVAPESSQYVRDFVFTVPFPKDFLIYKAGFPVDELAKTPHFDRLHVFFNAIETENARNTTLDIDKWSITSESEVKPPEIKAIRQIFKDIYEIQFTNSFSSYEKYWLNVNLGNSIVSNDYEFVTSYIEPDRGGGMFRTAASGCPPDCVGDLEADAEPPDVLDCANSHQWQLIPDCSATCYKQVEALETTTSYDFENCNYVYNANSDECYETEENTVHFGHECYPAINKSEFSNRDIDAMYVMVGHNPPPNPGPCGPISEEVEVVKNSDTIIPEIISATFDEYDTTGPGCTNQCCEEIKYILEITAVDNVCIDQFGTRLYLFYGDNYYIELCTTGSTSLINEQTMIQSFVFDNINIFACATRLKVIVHDKKGNWNSYDILPQEASATTRDSERLPYPHTLTIAFGNRVTQPGLDPANLDQRQYVNLERTYSEEIDPSVCVRTIDNASHGPLIYVEVEVIPPIPRVKVLVEYEDPPFRTGLNYAPTNKVDDPHNIDNTKFTPTYNGSMTLNEFKLLWGKHDPYPFWEPDGRTLGDNFNFYYTSTYQMNHPGIPDWDPIKAFPRAPTIPCFEKPACTALPVGHSCTDYYCDAGQTSLRTNPEGKAAVYLITMSHGGDNFKFKACGYNSFLNEKADCLKVTSAMVFTVWRKIFVDLSWMQARGSSESVCQGENEDFAYPENEDFYMPVVGYLPEWIKGVYDDAFIEIARGRELGPSVYVNSIPDGTNFQTLHDYADNATTYHNDPNFDSVHLISADHSGSCAGGLHGETVPPPSPPNYHWHSFVFKGEIFAFLKKHRDNILIETSEKVHSFA